MKISVFGTGYVGLVTGACFAENGNDVICVDIDEQKIEALNKGILPIYEPGLEELVHRNIQEERLSFTTDLVQPIKDSLIIFIAVGTPADEDGSADLKYVLNVAETIAKNINGYKIVVTKSTVPVGTADLIKKTIRQFTSQEFDVVSNPEFLKEGNAINDFLKPDRVVVGAEDVRVAEIMKELYAPFVRTGNPILIMDIRSAELTKYAANAMLALRISFMNEMARICDRIGADVNNVRNGISSDSRIGHAFLFPGLGYGGSCFPKDLKALVKTAADAQYDFKILKAVQDVNISQKEYFFPKILNYFKHHLEGKKFTLWGLSFKPKTDDIRDASSLTLIDFLLAHQAKVSVYDPAAVNAVKKIYDQKLDYGKNNYDALQGADALVVITEWSVFQRPDFNKIKELMRGKVIFDGRNLYDPETMVKMGFDYFAVGRKISLNHKAILP